MPPDDERPEPREKVASSRVPPGVHARATRKARKKGRSLSAIIRSFLMVWADDEYPDPPVMSEENTRAAKRPRKKK